jgi:hypothetical protein
MLQKRNLLFLSLLILGILLLSSCFLNPPATEGILKGQVMVPEGTIKTEDLTGQALPDATVNIINLETGAIIATATTDANGYYQISVDAGGPYLLEAIKGEVKLQQITPQVEVGMEYDLGTTDCTTTAAALIAQAMMDAGDTADIDCVAIMADPNFDDVSSIVCSIIKAGGDPTVSALVQQAIEDFLNPPTPTPSPAPLTADLTGLELSGSPSDYTFASGIYTYNGVTVANGITSITVTPTGTGTITVEGTEVATTVASGAIDLEAGDEETITVVATETGKTAKTYTVKVTREASSAKAITTFDFEALDPNVAGVINEGAKTITLTVPFGTDVTALVPTIVHTGASVSPASGIAQDFTSPVAYTVTAEDASIQAYVVTVTVTAPVIATSSTIANGAVAPTVAVTGTNFKSGIGTSDLTIELGTTGLTLNSVTFVSVTGITIVFTGTAGGGDVTIQVKTSAFEPASLSVSNTLTVTIPPAVINIAAILGVHAPVIGETPETVITETAQYTGTIIWNPTDSPFTSSTIYTSWVTLSPKSGFTLTGVTANFFTVAGATIVTNMINSGVVTAAFPETPVEVGDSHGGGIVAYIFVNGDTGYVAHEQHGLIAATADQGMGIQWYDGTSFAPVTGAIDTAIGSGQANTTAIVTTQGAGSYAAQLCNDLTEGGYSDWFLPSKEELNQLWLNKTAIGGFVVNYYWSSSEINSYRAWLQDFGSGGQTYDPKPYGYRVRAVRAF